MKKSRFTESQVAYALRQADAGTPVSDVCRSLGIAEATFYNWTKNSATDHGYVPGERCTGVSAGRFFSRVLVSQEYRARPVSTPHAYARASSQALEFAPRPSTGPDRVQPALEHGFCS